MIYVARFLAASVFCIAPLAHAAKCFSVGELSGVVVGKATAFQPDKDGFKNKVFQIYVNGALSIAPDWDTPCQETAENAVMCASTKDGARSVEFWMIDEPSGRVLFSRMRSGYGPYDGASTFTGKLLGACRLGSAK